MDIKTGIKRYVKSLAREFDPQSVILFGSYANGTATGNSDVDLLIITDKSGDPVEQALQMRRRIPRSFPLDILVQSRSNVRKRLVQNDTFLTSILRDGKVLYERKHTRVV